MTRARLTITSPSPCGSTNTVSLAKASPSVSRPFESTCLVSTDFILVESTHFPTFPLSHFLQAGILGRRRQIHCQSVGRWFDSNPGSQYNQQVRPFRRPPPTPDFGGSKR